MSSAIISICPSPPVITVPGTARMAYAPLKPSWPNVLYWLIVALRCRNGLVALAWVAHLVGDMHQPLHAGQLEDRGGNLTCVAWMGEPSQRIVSDGKVTCSGANLHAVWDTKLLEAATGFMQPDDAPVLAQATPSALARRCRPRNRL